MSKACAAEDLTAGLVVGGSPATSRRGCFCGHSRCLSATTDATPFERWGQSSASKSALVAPLTLQILFSLYWPPQVLRWRLSWAARGIARCGASDCPRSRLGRASCGWLHTGSGRRAHRSIKSRFAITTFRFLRELSCCAVAVAGTCSGLLTTDRIKVSSLGRGELCDWCEGP